jgi:hypothetical protein
VPRTDPARPHASKARARSRAANTSEIAFRFGRVRAFGLKLVKCDHVSLARGAIDTLLANFAPNFYSAQIVANRLPMKTEIFI